MINSSYFLIFVFILTLQQICPEQVLAETANDSVKTNVVTNLPAGNSSLDNAGKNRLKNQYLALTEKEMAAAFEQPFRYCRQKRHLDLIALIQKNYIPKTFVTKIKLHNQSTQKRSITADLLAGLIRPVKGRRNIQKYFVYNLLLYALSRPENREYTCPALIQAATIAFRKLQEPRTARLIYELSHPDSCNAISDSLSKLDNYLAHSLEIHDLLRVNYLRKDALEKQAYLKELELVLKQYPDTELKKETLRRIGDVAYLLQDYSTMMEHYQEVLKIAPQLEKSTPIGFRLYIANALLLRKRLGYFCAGIYFIVLIILLVRAWCSRSFEFRFFGKKLLIAGGIYLVAAFAIILLDQKTTPAHLYQLQAAGEIAYQKPLVPFGFQDILPDEIFLTALIVGFIPILYALIYISFKKQPSRIGLIFLILLLTSACWTHFALEFVYDTRMQPRGFFSGTHFYFRGELDQIIENSADKILEAAEKIPEPDRTKLKELIKTHQSN